MSHFIPRIVWLAAIFLLGGASAASAAVLRVQLGNTNAPQDGTSWERAFPAVTNAVTAAQAGDELWVAAGVYRGGFLLPAGIALYGGFAGTEASRDARVLQTNESVLDANFVSPAVVIATGAGATTRLDGFTIRNGFAQTGGGVFINGGSPAVVNNRFENNNAALIGTALYLENSNALVQSNHFFGNGFGLNFSVNGGALAVVGGSPRVERNSFLRNRGLDGGGAYLLSTQGTFTGNSFLDNEAARDGGALACVAASPQLTHNRLLGNVAGRRGGGLSLATASSPLVFNNVFVGNRAAANGSEPSGGGGVSVDATSQPGIRNNTLVGNTAPVGGVLCSNVSATIANNLIALGSSGVGGVAGLQLRRNNVFDNGGSNYVGIANATGTAGNLSADPLFAGEARRGVVNLLPESHCRDAGEATGVPVGALDLDGQPRQQGAAVDIGADEIDGVTRVFPPLIVRVTPSGSDVEDGTTWATAKRTIGRALDTVTRQGGEVWVAAGTYPENPALFAFTSLFGGFAGTENERTQRDWRTHRTIVDGRRRGNVFRLNSLREGDSLDGFTITGGLASAGAGAIGSGNGRIAHNRFVSNEVNIASSTATTRGGAGLHLAAGDRAEVIGNEFVGNVTLAASLATPSEGGGLKLASGTALIRDNVFRDNRAGHVREGGIVRGGGIFVNVQTNATTRVLHNTFVGNRALTNGGALWLEGEGRVTLRGNLFTFGSSGVAAATNNLADADFNGAFGNTGPDYSEVTPGAGSQAADPRFVNRQAGNHHLRADSPAIDAGGPPPDGLGSEDFHSAARVAGTAADLGADEFHGPALAPLAVTLTQPTPATVRTLTEPVQFTVELSAAEPLPALVEFLAGTNLLATVTNAPYTAAQTNLVIGDYEVSALLVMPTGALARSATNLLRIVAPPPTVDFPNLPAGKIFETDAGLNVRVAWAKLGGSIVAYDIATNGVTALMATNVAAGVTFTTLELRNLADGDYLVRAVVTDDTGQQATNSVSFRVQPPPQASAVSPPVSLPDGTLRLSFTAPTVEADYVLQSSTNLLNWTSVLTNAGGAPFEFIVPADATNRSEFFRTRAAYP